MRIDEAIIIDLFEIRFGLIAPNISIGGTSTVEIPNNNNNNDDYEKKIMFIRKGFFFHSLSVRIGCIYSEKYRFA